MASLTYPRQILDSTDPVEDGLMQAGQSQYLSMLALRSEGKKLKPERNLYS